MAMYPNLPRHKGTGRYFEVSKIENLTIKLNYWTKLNIENEKASETRLCNTNTKDKSAVTKAGSIPSYVLFC